MWECSSKIESEKLSTIEKQLDYLKENIKSVFDTDGSLYKNGFTYSSFCEMSDCAEAAKAFMLIYIKSDEQSTDIRKLNALNAYATYVK